MTKLTPFLNLSQRPAIQFAKAPAGRCDTLGRSAFSWLLVCAVIGVGAIRIVTTYHVFDQTTDEHAHIAAGLELIERRTWTLDPLGTP